jgi:hypothetical protein
VHPLDVRGKTPVNLTKGVFPVTGGVISRATPLAAGQEWKVVKSVPKNTLSTNSVAAARPERVARTFAGGTLGGRAVTMDRTSAIAYDAREHRFVNANGGLNQAAAANSAQPATRQSAGGVAAPSTNSTRVSGGPPPNARASTAPAPARNSLPASRTMASPPAPRSTGTGRAGSGGGSVYQPSSSSRSSAPAASAAPRASSGGSSSASSGGRPH